MEGRPVAGKTGTTNEARDAWFIGYTPDLVVGVFVGFDNPTPLGRGEGGSRAASPIFASFMSQALEGSEVIPFRLPEGVPTQYVDPITGTIDVTRMANDGRTIRGSANAQLVPTIQPGAPQNNGALGRNGFSNSRFGSSIDSSNSFSSQGSVSNGGVTTTTVDSVGTRSSGGASVGAIY